MVLDSTTQSPARQTVQMLRLTLKHRAEFNAHVVVIEHGELNAWINLSRKHRFAFEAELIDPADIASADIAMAA